MSTVASGVVGIVIGVVVVGVCNRSQMRTSKCTCLIFGVTIGLDLARNAQKEFLIRESSRSHATYCRPSLDGFNSSFILWPSYLDTGEDCRRCMLFLHHCSSCV